MTSLLMALSGFAAAALAVGGIRKYALTRSILDFPNERSSHDVPTPSGGGMGIILTFVGLAGAFLALGGQLRVGTALALGAVLSLAIVGWVDDRTGVSVPARLLLHVAAGMALVPLAVAGMGSLAAVALIAAFWVFAAVSAINVINFMDGIDGLIGSQVLLFGVHLAVLSPGGTESRVWGLMLAATCAGFLLWNWPPARIFMGDAGSGALGLAAVAGGLLLVRPFEVSPFVAFLPLYPLFLDAATTLARRVLRGERIWQAHRSHLYQRLANGQWGHLRVTLLYAAAAAVGMFVAAVSETVMGPVLVALYVLGGLAAGVALERTAPPVSSVSRPPDIG
jgi:Fuc2NAc and GlcNAc transferase